MRGLLKNVGLRSNDGVSRGLVPDEDVTDTSPDMVCLFSLEEVVTEDGKGDGSSVPALRSVFVSFCI